ncbi:MAG TPA: hypothetical protein VGU46_12660 [Acidobacteriaceae bacterium]|nr:hypothetical protein [Acidobacteriaceae bacterium]
MKPAFAAFCASIRSYTALLDSALMVMMLIANISTVSHAQGRDRNTFYPAPVIVDLGKPNVWTLDQAHYLLERNRARDLGISTVDLNQLDPNDINGIRISSLQSLLSTSVNFNQADAFKNRAAIADLSAAKTRSADLLKQRDTIRDQLFDLDKTINDANTSLENAKASNASDSSAVKSAQAQLNALNAQRAALSKQYDLLTTEMTAATSTSSVAGTSASDPLADSSILKGPVDTNSLFGKLLADYAKSTDSTKLAASIRLDNYINMQYEIVAKQLTLLRDQAGPDNKVIFLELPQSIYYTDKLRLYPYLGGWWGTHILQTWYRLDEAVVAIPPVPVVAIPPTPQTDSAIDDRPPSKGELRLLTKLYETTQTDVNTNRNARALITFFDPARLNLQGDKYSLLGQTGSQAIRGISAKNKASEAAFALSIDDESLLASTSLSPTALPKTNETNKNSEKCPTEGDTKALCTWQTSWSFRTILSALNRPNQIDPARRIDASQGMGIFSSPPSEQTMYALDLIPRQSTLNVAEANVTSRKVGFSGLFSFLTGFGAQTRYERQKDQFGQFIQEETYASAFGKGAFEFGWTFGPLPGTNRLAPGIRTTYAIVVVPKNVRVIRMLGIGCGYRRRNVPLNPFATIGYLNYETRDEQDRLKWLEDCSAMSTFDIEVPDTSDTLHVDDITCSQIPSGQRAVLEIKGRFDDQVGMLINGTPITRVPSITQPKLFNSDYTIPQEAGDTDTRGVFEVVSGSQLVASIKMSASFNGAPKITLVSAGKEVSRLIGCKVVQQPAATTLFRQPTSITGISVSQIDNKDFLKLTILGQGFVVADTGKEPETVLLAGDQVIPYFAQGKLPENTNTPSNPTGYVTEKQGVMQALVPRRSVPGDVDVNYQVMGTESTSSFTGKYTDDLPPVLSADSKSCTVAKDKEGDGAQYTCHLSGKFFSDQYVIKAIGSGVSLVSSSRTDDKNWDAVIHADKPLKGDEGVRFVGKRFSADPLYLAKLTTAPKEPAAKGSSVKKVHKK